MGRAIVREPAAFLFDEPLSNLDAKLRVQMRVEIRRLQRSLATTSVYVTHDQMEAMTLADRLVVLNGGRIEQVGAPIELYERPATTFVATFIGSPSMNLLKATENSKIALSPGGGLGGADTTIGIRPEDLHRRGHDRTGFQRKSAYPGGGARRRGKLCLRYPRGWANHRLSSFGAVPDRGGHRMLVTARAGSLHFFDGRGNRLSPA